MHVPRGRPFPVEAYVATAAFQTIARRELLAAGLSDTFDDVEVDESVLLERLDVLGTILASATRQEWLGDLPSTVQCEEDVSKFVSVVKKHAKTDASLAAIGASSSRFQLNDLWR